MAVAVIGHGGGAVGVGGKVEAVPRADELVEVAVAAPVHHQGVVLDKAAQALVAGVGADIGLAGVAAVVVLQHPVILAHHTAQDVVVLLLIGAFHALQVGHVGAPGIPGRAGAIDAGLGVVAAAAREHRVADRIAAAGVVDQDEVRHFLDGLFHLLAGGGRDLVHRGVGQGVGRRPVLVLVFQIRMDGDGLRLPCLGGGVVRNFGKIADGAQFGVGDAHQAVHQVHLDVPPQALALDVQIVHRDLVLAAQPQQVQKPLDAVFLLQLLRDGHLRGVRPADGVGGQGLGGCRKDEGPGQRQGRQPLCHVRFDLQTSSPSCIAFIMVKCTITRPPEQGWILIGCVRVRQGRLGVDGVPAVAGVGQDADQKETAEVFPAEQFQPHQKGRG